ncbi:MAG: sulfatase-like hydrolase/transferase, partial [Bacteroidales bacterium]|nr:sulfatase-like hydrolase/transferase [Bacteroidales bacterium]
YENTLIIFTSDNGPTYIDADVEWFNSANPFQTKTGRTKGYLYEGGIRVPMIASWPKVIPAASQTNHISAFWDVMPTLCDIAGTKAPVYTDGISFLPTLEGGEQKQKDYYYWEFAGYNGQQSVRIGKWKGIRKNIKKGNLYIELYNLDEDIKEEHDLADKHPDIIKKIADIMLKEHHTASVARFKLPAIDSLIQ